MQTNQGSAAGFGGAQNGSADAARAAREAAVLRKVYQRMGWFIFLMFAIAFLDRVNIGFAALTMNKALGLTATMFGVAMTTFTIAYLVCGIPSNVMLDRVGGRRWLSFLMLAWGVASSACMFASGPNSLYVLRLVVGAAEAGFVPGLLLYLSYWFPAAYRARANAMFMIGYPVTTAVASVLSGFILKMDGIMHLAGWQWMFLLEGLPSIIVGVAVLNYLSDRPSQAAWLTDDEKATLADVLAADKAGQGASGGRLKAMSPTVIFLGIVYLCLTNTMSMIGYWVPQIVKSFNAGSSFVTIGLLAAVPQVFTLAGIVLWGRHSDRTGERKWHIVLPMLVAGAGWLLTALAADPTVRLAGIALASTGSFATMVVFWTVPNAQLASDSRALGLAVINTIGNLGAITGPLLMGVLKDWTHTFTSGLISAAVVMAVGALLATFIKGGAEKGQQG